MVVAVVAEVLASDLSVEDDEAKRRGWRGMEARIRESGFGIEPRSGV